VIALFATTPCVARAATDEACEGPAAREELALRDRVLADTRAWSRGWGIGFGGLLGLQLVTSQAISSQARKTDLYVSMISTTAGLATTLIIGPRVFWPDPAAPGGTGPCAELARARRQLDLAARDERFITSWQVHVGSKLFSLGMAATLGYGFGHWPQAAFLLPVGFLVGELIIATFPRTVLERGSKITTALTFSQGSPALGLSYSF
jgi:hypothetical protein